MTGKEIIRALLRGRRTERLAWVPCIDPYTQSGLPEELRRMDLFALQEHFGSDLFRGGCAYGERLDPSARHHQRDLGGGRVLDTYATPRGELREVHTFVPESPYIPFPTEHLIKNFADLETFEDLVERTEVVPDDARLREAVAAYPGAMVSSSLCDTPLPELMTKLIGTDTFVYMHQEDPGRMRRAMEVMQAKHRRQVEVSVRSPAELFICYENTNTASFGVRWIMEYELPWLDEYADLVHGAGKHLLVHMCGRIQRVVPQIAQRRLDGVIDVAPPPTGDCDIPAAVRTLGTHGKLLGGGIECNTFTLADPEEFARRTAALVAGVAGQVNFLLGSGDAVPQGTSAANLLRAAAIAKGTTLA